MKLSSPTRSSALVPHDEFHGSVPQELASSRAPLPESRTPELLENSGDRAAQLPELLNTEDR
jgi:hypothetical protein